MTQKRVPKRDEVDPKYTWNAQSVFESIEAWESEVVAIGELIEAMADWQGHLAEGPAVLLEALPRITLLAPKKSLSAK